MNDGKVMCGGREANADELLAAIDVARALAALGAAYGLNQKRPRLPSRVARSAT